MKEKVDWYIHCILGDAMTYHTHGAAKYCGNEIELNLPVNENTAMSFINHVVLHCRNEGVKITPGVPIHGIFNVPVLFIEVEPIAEHQGEATIFRLLLPDANGKLPGDNGCDDVYARQLVSPKRTGLN